MASPDSLASRRRVAFVARSFRDGWSMVGVALLLFLAAEGAYRGGRGLYHLATPRRQAGLAAQDHPYATAEWFEPWVRSRDEIIRNRVVFDPYLGWRIAPQSFPGLTLDSAGYRVTVQRPAGSGDVRHVLLLGGSTMWGYDARDSATIPSLVARRLTEHGVTGVQVDNLAQAGYNATQGLATLMLEIRGGRIPVAVVSLDGVNDVDAVVSGDPPGAVLDQHLAERRFAKRNVFLDAIGHSELLSKLLLLSSKTRSPANDALPPCDQIARLYRGVALQFDALSKAYGFTTFMLWQPTLAESHKRRTSFEETLAHDFPQLQDASRRCGSAADSAMRDVTGRLYFPLHALFDGDTLPVFIDFYGHVTERANGLIADRITDLLLPVLARSH